MAPLPLAAIGTAPRRSALVPALQAILRGSAAHAATARAAGLGTSFSVVSKGGRDTCAR